MANMESELWPLLEQLKEDIADVSDALKPLTKTPLLDNAAKLPLVDKAKLYVLTTYALESLLFSYLDLNGINPKEHPVMKELERVKQYFAKIKEAEAKTAGTSKQTLTLDKQAAGRFIKHALAGNEQYDRERTEDIARQKANAHIKFNELGEPVAPEPEQKSPERSSEEEGEELVMHGAAPTAETEDTNTTSGPNDEEGDEESDSSSSPKEVCSKSPRQKSKSHKESRKERKEERKEKRKKDKKKEKRARKKQKKSDKSSSE